MRIIHAHSLTPVMNVNGIVSSIGGTTMKPIRMFILNIDRENETALVENYRTGKIFPVKISFKESWKLKCVQRGDDALVVKSGVTGEWLMVDYSFSNAFNYAVHNQGQTKYEDMITDERGVPYDF